MLLTQQKQVLLVSTHARQHHESFSLRLHDTIIEKSCIYMRRTTYEDDDNT